MAGDGLQGGPVCPPVLEVTEEARAELKADLKETGIVDRSNDG